MTAIISGSGRQVTIANTTFERIIQKAVVLINIPTTFQKWLNGAKPSKTVDLLRVEKRINIDGHLKTDLGIGDTSSSAIGKRDDLIYIIEHGGASSFIHKSTSATAIIDKCQFNEEPEDESGDPTRIVVKLTAIEGVNL